MRIITPVEVAAQTGNKYLGMLVAAKFARYVNDFPRDRSVDLEKKLTTRALEELVGGRLQYRLVRRRRAGRLMRLTGRRVVLGVSGGIASYKSCTLARRLTEEGADVAVVLTAAAGEFVRPVVFEALTGRPVLTSLWERGRALAHIGLAKDTDLVILAPATAQLLARAAQGMADDLLAALLLARTGPVLCAPAMNDAMYAHPASVANLKLLASRGWHFVGPDVGALAEGPSTQPGRMSEPEAILAAAARLLAPEGPLKGKHVLITAGPTREHIDPVRVITNPSSGRTGYALAEAVSARGGEVVLVTGPTALPLPGAPRCIASRRPRRCSVRCNPSSSGRTC